MLPWSESIQIAVIGDILLDEYWEGNVTRISPEAPVPVLNVQDTIHTPGGAANTARNIACAGASANLYGVWGADETAQILKNLLEADRVNTEGVLKISDRTTIRKTRLTSSRQQLIRIDWEKTNPIDECVQTQVLETIRKGNFQALVISDYGKGALPESLVKNLILLAQEKGIPSIVDPKGKDYSKYVGCTLITPNRKEALEALQLDNGDQALKGHELGQRLQKHYGLSDVLVTLGADGMVFVSKDKSTFIYKTSKAREVFDVSGAGDTVVAIMALGLASKCNIDETIHLANIAAGLVVEKWRTQPIFKHEIEKFLLDEASPLSTQKCLNLSSFLEIREHLCRAQKRVVFTNGCFDVLHVGHLDYLEKAKALGAHLVVGLNSDASVSRLKGPTRPFNFLENRMRLLAGFHCVDSVVVFDEDTPKAIIESIRPDVLVKGADYQEHEIVGAEFVKSYNGKVERIALVPDVSSTRTIEKLVSSSTAG